MPLSCYTFSIAYVIGRILSSNWYKFYILTFIINFLTQKCIYTNNVEVHNLPLRCVYFGIY